MRIVKDEAAYVVVQVVTVGRSKDGKAERSTFESIKVYEATAEQAFKVVQSALEVASRGNK